MPILSNGARRIGAAQLLLAAAGFASVALAPALAPALAYDPKTCQLDAGEIKELRGIDKRLAVIHRDVRTKGIRFSSAEQKEMDVLVQMSNQMRGRAIQCQRDKAKAQPKNSP